MFIQNSTQHNAHPGYRKSDYRRAATKTDIDKSFQVETLDVAPPIPPKRYLLQQRRLMQEQLLEAKREQAAKARQARLAKNLEAKPSKYGLETMKPSSFSFFSGLNPAKLASGISTSASQIKKVTKLEYFVREYMYEGKHGVGVWCTLRKN